MKHLFFGLKYVISYRLSNVKKPLICGLVVHNRCNLKCLHCRITDRPEENGTFPLETSADTLFISLDGLQKTNDFIRGNVFNKIMRNINESDHPSLYINFTINNINKSEILDFCDFINGIKKIKGIFFYFHTPYYGYDNLFINNNEKKEILTRLLENRGKYKILNSVAGLKSGIRNDWERPLNICQIYEGNKTYDCCRFPGNKDLCNDCGYLSYAEIDQVLKMKPSAVRNAIKYFRS